MKIDKKIKKVEHKIEILKKFYNEKMLKYKYKLYMLNAEKDIETMERKRYEQIQN